MTDPIHRGRIEWRAKFESDSQLWRIRGTDTLRDQPIELALTSAELRSLAHMLDRIIVERSAIFQDLELHERTRG